MRRDERDLMPGHAQQDEGHEIKQKKYIHQNNEPETELDTSKIKLTFIIFIIIIIAYIIYINQQVTI